MEVVLEAIEGAWQLLVGRDPVTYEVLWRSLRISLSATAIALALGLPIGLGLAVGRFPGRRTLFTLANTGMGLPPIVVGLVVTVLLWRSGPLGGLGLLYTPTAMVIAQAAIATPIVVALSAAALQHVDAEFRLQMRGIGANRLRSLWELGREARLPLLAVAMAGFGAAISEVGAALMVGGNLQGETRVLTTAAVLEASRGRFAAALAFGFVLLTVALAVNLTLTTLQQRDRTTHR
jgi:tungstate transport system permease protein